ncbi:protein LSM12 homolog isoform X1 [Zootermopsis nevadensis]|uniref:protein LSM12 homolog isoform X1 n=1 Tax=Zootermopsis nevadensis TaxID=136037 RepID=UPI000B8E89C0|nr:protein LSM12 homolog isoform X1 [Zootermopsis nevadensis]
MRHKMAGVNECFSIGSIVACKTCYNKEIEGEVLAFDPQTKMLILTECPATNGQTPLNDVHIINLSLVSDVQVKKEVNTVPEPPQSLDLYRLNIRVRNQIDEKRRLVTALSASVPPEGQKLFYAISKTIKEVSWQGSNIVVFDTVTITPPYKLDNVRAHAECKALMHIRKVVEKHMREQAAAEAGTSVAGAQTSPQ